MLRPLSPTARESGLTLVELLVAITIAGILLTIGVPTLYDFVLMQRLKGVNAQLVTDLQFARSEAVARNQFARLDFRFSDTLSCYTIFTARVNADRCDCRASAESTCSGSAVAVRTVRLPRADKVVLRLPQGQGSGFAFDHVSGGIVSTPSDRASMPLAAYRIEALLDDSRVLRNVIGQSGRVSVCAPAGINVGADAC